VLSPRTGIDTDQPAAQLEAPGVVLAVLVTGAMVEIPTAQADNTRLNDSVVANVYTVQHQAGCTTNVHINPQLRLAAQWFTHDVLNNRNLNNDTGSDDSTPQDRANAAGFHGKAVPPMIDESGRRILYVGEDLATSASEVFGEAGIAAICPRYRCPSLRRSARWRFLTWLAAVRHWQSVRCRLWPTEAKHGLLPSSGREGSLKIGRRGRTCVVCGTAPPTTSDTPWRCGIATTVWRSCVTPLIASRTCRSTTFVCLGAYRFRCVSGVSM
jgi:hypothetical protein